MAVKYKAGDRVRLIEDVKWYCVNPPCCMKAGDEVELIDEEPRYADTCIRFTFPRSSTGFLRLDAKLVELVAPKEPCPHVYKKGDKARVVKASGTCWVTETKSGAPEFTLKVGDVIEIFDRHSISPEYIRFTHPDLTGKTSWLLVKLDEIEPLEPDLNGVTDEEKARVRRRYRPGQEVSFLPGIPSIYLLPSDAPKCLQGPGMSVHTVHSDTSLYVILAREGAIRIVPKLWVEPAYGCVCTWDVLHNNGQYCECGGCEYD
jgi:hypothetical protein